MYYYNLLLSILPEGKVHISCVDLLIRTGANIDQQVLYVLLLIHCFNIIIIIQAFDGSTVLHLSAYTGSVSLMELLLMNGANPDIRDNDGRLSLHWSTNPTSTKPMDTLLKVPYHLFIQSIYLLYIYIYIYI